MIENSENGFQFSAIGFIWTNYHPDSYRAVLEKMNTQTMEMINAFLAVKLTPASFAFVILLPIVTAIEYFALRLAFGWIGGNNKSYAQSRKAPTMGKKGTKMEYKRK